MNANNKLNLKNPKMKTATFQNEYNEYLYDQYNSDIKNDAQEDTLMIKEMQNIEQKQNNITDHAEEDYEKGSTIYNYSNNTNKAQEKKKNHLKKKKNNPHKYFTQNEKILPLNQDYQLNQHYNQSNYTSKAFYPVQYLPTLQCNQKQEYFHNQQLYERPEYLTQNQYQNPDFNKKNLNLYTEKVHQMQKFQFNQKYSINQDLDLYMEQQNKIIKSPQQGPQYNNLLNKYNLLAHKDLSWQNEYQIEQQPIQKKFLFNKKFINNDYFPKHVSSFQQVDKPQKWYNKYDYIQNYNKQLIREENKKSRKRRKIRKNRLFRRAKWRKYKRKTSFKKFYYLKGKIQNEKIEDINCEEIKSEVTSYLIKKNNIRKNPNEADKILIQQKNKIAQNEIGNEENKNLENKDINLPEQNKNEKNIEENCNPNEMKLDQMENNIPTIQENHIIFTYSNFGENDHQVIDHQNNPEESNFESIYNGLIQFANHMPNFGNNYTDLEEESNFLDNIPPEYEKNEEDIIQGNCLDVQQNHPHS